jgi:hypothetical protein
MAARNPGRLPVGRRSPGRRPARVQARDRHHPHRPRSSGATASSEAADVVLTVDRVDALADAILIARRSKRIALQAVLIGMGLSFMAMAVAAVGLLPPAAGAVVQEVIDVLAIGIALRAVLPGRVHSIAMPAEDIATAVRLRAEHDAVQPVIEQIRSVADALSTHHGDLDPVHALLGRLEGELLPHERADEELLVPLVDRALGGTDATAAISRTHAEIEHQVGRLRRLLDGLDPDTTEPEDIVELRRLLYGLYAVLRLHNAQEEEEAFSLSWPVPDRLSPTIAALPPCGMPKPPPRATRGSGPGWTARRGMRPRWPTLWTSRSPSSNSSTRPARSGSPTRRCHAATPNAPRPSSPPATPPTSTPNRGSPPRNGSTRITRTWPWRSRTTS